MEQYMPIVWIGFAIFMLLCEGFAGTDNDLLCLQTGLFLAGRRDASASERGRSRYGYNTACINMVRSRLGLCRHNNYIYKRHNNPVSSVPCCVTCIADCDTTACKTL